MNKILPFKAVRAAEDKVGLFVTRNYQSYNERTFQDKISNNPYSFLNIISKSNNTNNFSKIRVQFEKFIDDQILIKDKNESFYLYQITKDEKKSIGIISLFSTSNLKNGILKKHENTIKKREKIFQRYLLDTQINAEPVLIFHKENSEINKIIELYKKKNHTYNFTTTDRVNHKLWKISEKSLIDEIIINYNQINEFYIADGHHRVSSSNLISKKLKKETFFLSFLASEKNIYCGSFIRYIDNIEYAHADFLEEIKKKFELKDIYKNSKVNNTKSMSDFITIFINNTYYDLLLKKEYVNDAHFTDTQIIDYYIFNQILNIRDTKQTERVKYIESSKIELFLNQNPLNKNSLLIFTKTIDSKQLMQIADNNLILPPKSTYIEPKIRSGITIYDFKS
tara:strand:- start:53356 stop:54540 length:1185 start_codon:yes stop_codon:yes gene_type:complete